MVETTKEALGAVFGGESDEAEDVAEMMQHWKACEALVFCDRAQKAPEMPLDSSEGAVVLDNSARRRMVRIFRYIFTTIEVAEDIPMALTIYDALSLKCARGFPSPSVPVAAIAATIARMSLSVSSGALSEEYEWIDFAEKLSDLEDEMVTPNMIAIAETHIIAALDGRIKQHSPTEWSAAMVKYIQILGAPHQALLASEAHVNSWGLFLSDMIAADVSLPPKSLGLVACVLGMLSARVIQVEELRPSNVGEDDWTSSFLVQIHDSAVQTGVQQHQENVGIDLLSRILENSKDCQGIFCDTIFELSHQVQALLIRRNLEEADNANTVQTQ